MLWQASSPFEPNLPAHCEPTNDFLLHFSGTFHTCIPTPLAFVSTSLGILSIIAWLFSQLPQIYKNWSISSTSGLSFFFLVEWFLGDLSNLLGAIFTHQATWQVAIGSYYVFVDLCLVSQWIWYEKLKHGRKMRKVWPRSGAGEDDWSSGGMQTAVNHTEELDSALRNSDNGQRVAAKPQTIFKAPGFHKQSRKEVEKPSSSLSATPGGTTVHRVGASSPMPSPFSQDHPTYRMLSCNRPGCTSDTTARSTNWKNGRPINTLRTRRHDPLMDVNPLIFRFSTPTAYQELAAQINRRS